MSCPRPSSRVVFALVGGGSLLLGPIAGAQESTDRPATDLASHGVRGIMFGTAAPRGGDEVLWDNGPPDGSNGYSNATEGVLGSRRTLLDDFVVPSGGWTIGGLRWEHLWNTFPPGSGTGAEFLLRADDGGAPGPILGDLVVTGYGEVGTGVTYFSRPGAQSWVTIEPATLDQGRYWFEGTIVGPENDFWLVRTEVTGGECWVNYDDVGGLQSGTSVFGVPADLSFQLLGTTGCAGDVDDSGTVDFGDIAAVLAAWGTCGGCPEDLDENGIVDMREVLVVLGSWGPCPESIGACCLPDGCVDDITEGACDAMGGDYRGDRTSCATECPTGACCFPEGGCRDDLNEVGCFAAGGDYQGDHTTCADECPSGACCYDHETCVEDTLEVTCLTTGGIYLGDQSTCAEGCPPPCGSEVQAPFTWTGSACGEGNDCAIRQSEDVHWEVTIPEGGDWTFSACGPELLALYVNTRCCGLERRTFGTCDSVTVRGLFPGQIVFVTVEAFGGCEPFTVEITRP